MMMVNSEAQSACFDAILMILCHRTPEPAASVDIASIVIETAPPTQTFRIMDVMIE